MSHLTALLVVDIQPDFLAGGALPVSGDDSFLEPLTSLLTEGRFDLAIATQDWHPPDHISFASNHTGRAPFETIELYGKPQTLWPDHCVQASPGAALHPSLPTHTLAAIVRKGMEPEVDSYSAFRNNWNADGQRPHTGLAGYLRERGVRELWVAGLAREFCVLWSAEDAADAGFSTNVLWDLTRPVDPASDEQVQRALDVKCVRVVHGHGP